MSTFSSNIGPEEEDGGGWQGLVPTKAEREEEKRWERERQAKNYATTLAINIHAKHYPEVTQWKPLPDTLGLLTQIDNMTSGLTRQTDTERLMVDALTLAVQAMRAPLDDWKGELERKALDAARAVLGAA